jgi:hypothetical protein
MSLIIRNLAIGVGQQDGSNSRGFLSACITGTRIVLPSSSTSFSDGKAWGRPSAARPPRSVIGELAGRMHSLHTLCDSHGDVATASLLETWIDDT